MDKNIEKASERQAPGSLIPMTSFFFIRTRARICAILVMIRVMNMVKVTESPQKEKVHQSSPTQSLTSPPPIQPELQAASNKIFPNHNVGVPGKFATKPISMSGNVIQLGTL